MEKHIRMRFFADWESERSSPSSTPRECFLQITNLTVFKIPDCLELALSSGVFLSVKIVSGGPSSSKNSIDSMTDKWQKRMNRLMSGSKKDFLRSNEIPLSSGDFTNIPLDLSFSIIYSHKLKGGGSKLSVMIEKKNYLKKKKTKGSAYETLASGEINLSKAFQRKSRNFELDLTTDKKEGEKPSEGLIARVHISGLTVQPTDTWRNRPSLIWNVKCEKDVENEKIGSADEEVGEMEDGERKRSVVFSEPVIVPSQDHFKKRNSIVTRRGTTALRMKFLSFWRRLRPDDSKLYRETMTKKLSQIKMGLREFKEESKADGFVPWDEISGEARSDSGTELDSCSVSSNPRPSLRPYFSNNSLLEIDKPPTPSPSNPLSNDPLKRHRFGKRLISKRLMKAMSPTRNLSSAQPAAP